MKIQLDYYNSKKELRSKSVTPDELHTLIRSGRYEKSCNALSFKLATIPNIDPRSTMEDAGRLPVVRFGVGGEGTYTGYVLLSFKAPDAELRDHLQREATKLPQTLLVFEGSSRRSMKVVVAFTRPDGTLPRGEEATLFHQHAIAMAYRFYSAQLGMSPDNKAPRIDRGCRISDDPDAYLNADVKPMLLTQPTAPAEPDTIHPLSPMTVPSLPKTFPGYDEMLMAMTKFQFCYRHALEEGASDADLFLESLARECQRNDISEEFAVRRVLHKSPYGSMELLVRSCFRNVYDRGQGATATDSAIPDATLQMARLKDFMERRYRLRRNALTGEVDYLPLGGLSFTWDAVTKEVMNRMVFDAITEGITVWDKDVKRYVESTFVSDYNPISDYLSSLPAWDGIDRIEALSNRVPTSNGRWPEYFHTWLLSMVSQWTGMHRIHGNTMVPLLIGAQGDGKSTFCKLLLPAELRMYYTDRLDFTNKNDAERSMSRFALINIDEFDSITKRQQAFLKHILQKSSVMSRQLYSSVIRENRRFAAFIGTTNDPCPLTDPSGSRRYLCIRTGGKIDTGTPIDYPQLYAQLKCELGAGYRSWFTGEEEAAIQESNAEFRQFDSLEEEFLSLYHKPTDADTGAFRSIPAMIGVLRSQFRGVKDDSITYQKFGKMLKRLGYRHRHVMKGNEYLVVRNGDDGNMTADDGTTEPEPP
jgi:hypothetical protein